MDQEKRTAVDVEATAGNDGGQEMPFILQFLEAREGAMSATMTGTWDDCDAAPIDRSEHPHCSGGRWSTRVLSPFSMLHPELAARIIEMARVDQLARSQCTERHPVALNVFVYAVDGVHQYRLRQIIERYGYPTRRMIGKRGMHALWLLVQHQDFDRELQEQCLARCDFDRKDRAFSVTDDDRVILRLLDINTAKFVDIGRHQHVYGE